MKVDESGCKWMQVDASGCNWMQLDAIRCNQKYIINISVNINMGIEHVVLWWKLIDNFKPTTQHAFP